MRGNKLCEEKTGSPTLISDTYKKQKELVFVGKEQKEIAKNNTLYGIKSTLTRKNNVVHGQNLGSTLFLIVVLLWKLLREN